MKTPHKLIRVNGTLYRLANGIEEYKDVINGVKNRLKAMDLPWKGPLEDDKISVHIYVAPSKGDRFFNKIRKVIATDLVPPPQYRVEELPSSGKFVEDESRSTEFHIGHLVVTLYMELTHTPDESYREVAEISVSTRLRK